MDTKYIIINPKHSPEKHFFLSHKDPENTFIASRLDHYLKKIGFIGYVAENDPKPGLDIWTEKIFPIHRRLCMHDSFMDKECYKFYQNIR